MEKEIATDKIIRKITGDFMDYIVKDSGVSLIKMYFTYGVPPEIVLQEMSVNKKLLKYLI